MEKLKELGSLFYVVNPYETMFEKVSDIPTPDWTAKVIVHCTKRESPNAGTYMLKVDYPLYVL